MLMCVCVCSLHLIQTTGKSNREGINNKQDPKVTIDRQEQLKKGDYNASLFLVSAKTQHRE